jgi:hypothetical protein
MRRLFVIACTAVALTACGNKKEAAENGSLAENLALESAPANDASALEAVEAESANLLIPGGNEEDSENATISNADSNADSNSQ